MPFGTRNERDVMSALDYSQIYPHLKRVSLGCKADALDEMKRGLAEEIKKVPEWAEPETMHNQRSFQSAEDLCNTVLMTREAGIRHHSFHYYGMSRRHELEWIGHARQAWA